MQVSVSSIEEPDHGNYWRRQLSVLLTLEHMSAVKEDATFHELRAFDSV